MKKVFMFLIAAALVVPAVFAQNDSETQAAVQKALGSSRFKGVQASVHHVKGVTAVRNDVEVAGAEISDQQLQQKLQKAITYDLWGNVPIQFQAITVQVQNGVATVGGHAAGPVAAADAIAVVANTKGVKDVMDNIQVDPLSDFDDRIRAQEFRAIYGYPLLNQFAIDPEKPIRIQVANGHVTLYGTVDNQSQKNAAGIQANTVPGVFSVTNQLQVANGSNEKPGK
jgi:osmotically-inducible protein OsmY